MSPQFARPHLVLTAIMAATFAVTGCSSADSKIYDSYKCGKVATMMGQSVKAGAAIAKAAPYFKDLKVKESQYVLHLQTKFTDDLALYRLSPAGQAKAVLEMFESSTCQKLYE